MAVHAQSLKERILADGEEGVRRIRRDAVRPLAVLLAHGHDSLPAEHAHAVDRAVAADRDAQPRQIARTDEQAADGHAVVRVRQGLLHILLTQHVRRRGIERAVLVVRRGDVVRIGQLRGAVRRVDAQRLKERLSHVGGHVHPGHGLDDRAGDARSEIGIGIFAAGLHVCLEIAARFLFDVDHVGQNARLTGKRAVFHQARRVGHQHPQRDGRIHVARIAHGVSQVCADVLVRIEDTLVHHLHQADARDQLRHGRAAKVGVRADRHMRRLLLLAVVALIDDAAVLGNDKRAAHGLRRAEHLVHTRVHVQSLSRSRHGKRHQQRQHQRQDSPHPSHQPFACSLIYCGHTRRIVASSTFTRPRCSVMISLAFCASRAAMASQIA